MSAEVDEVSSPVGARSCEASSLIQKLVSPLQRLSMGPFVTEPSPPKLYQAFMKKHGYSLAKGTEEYEKRLTLFQSRFEEVHRLNQRPNRLWTAGINRLADRTDNELLSLRGWRGGAVPSQHRTHGANHGVNLLSLNGRAKALPDQVSWTHLNSTKAIRNQGSCGSCWAIASATVLEAHNEIHMAHAPRTFSTQELVSCVPNIDNCGGKGGCDGATVELAMDYAMHHGLAKESEVPYTEGTGTCNRPANLVQAAPKSLSGKDLGTPGAHLLTTGMLGDSFGMTGWERLPENGYEALMRALVERGPVAVSAAGSNWFFYEGGIFDHCERDAVIDHAVSLMGYGADAAADQKYWLIQNSWGEDWGEKGRIRLLRADGDQTERCGTDNQPELGTGCNGGPSKVTVCGMCGLLYDSVVPHFGEADAEKHFREQLGH